MGAQPQELSLRGGRRLRASPCTAAHLPSLAVQQKEYLPKVRFMIFFFFVSRQDQAFPLSAPALVRRAGGFSRRPPVGSEPNHPPAAERTGVCRAPRALRGLGRLPSRSHRRRRGSWARRSAASGGRTGPGQAGRRRGPGRAGGGWCPWKPAHAERRPPSWRAAAAIMLLGRGLDAR